MKEDYNIEELLSRGGFDCSCGKRHSTRLQDAVIGRDAIGALPRLIHKYGGSRALLLADDNTFAAAGERVTAELEKTGIPCSRYLYGKERVIPDEKAIGSALMHFDDRCGIIVGIGSGVINDIGKIIAHASGRPYIICATAPSVDGFASGTSSVIMDGLKVSLNSTCPDAVIGDLDVLCAAPMRMILSGYGDMTAKYVSICEWRLSNVINGEYYCPEVAAMIRCALNKCTAAREGLTRRDPAAVKSVMEGLVISGIAADYAGVSRPVSGTEHYFSHIWDMRALSFGTQEDLHGIQCGVGTALTIRAYELLRGVRPDKDKAAAYAASFSFDDWSGQIKEYLGRSAAPVIAAEADAHKYDKTGRALRFDRISEQWDELMRICGEELPEYDDFCRLLSGIGAPVKPSQIGQRADMTGLTLKMTKDVRDKYILARLLWDIGELDETADRLNELTVKDDK